MHTFDNDLALISDVTLWPLIWLQFDITKVDFRGFIKVVGGQFSLSGAKGLTGGRRGFQGLYSGSGWRLEGRARARNWKLVDLSRARC